MLALYHHGNSACSAKVRLVLAEKGLEWTSHYIDIFKGEQFEPGYARLNPKRVVPTLVHNGGVVRESSVICEYIDETFPEPSLVPVDALARAGMRVWTKAVDEEIHPATRVVTFAASHRYTMLEKSPDEMAALLDAIPDSARREAKRQSIELGFEFDEARRGLKLFEKTVGQMEETLSETEWLAGDAFTLADAALAIYINRLEVLSMAGMWEAGRRPRVANWWARIKFRQSFRPAVIDWVPDDLATALRDNGARSWPQVKQILEGS